MVQQLTAQFNWADELEKNVLQSLTTTFGLDFLLMQDKHGGDVDTIYNARQGIYATEKERQAYENRGEYDSHSYHSDPNYIQRGKSDKQAHLAGNLYDAYRDKKLARSENRQLDHIQSSKEIHDDAGRVLAEMDGTTLANQDSNLQSTFWYINNAKRDHSAEKFVNEIAPKMIADKKELIHQQQEKLKTMPESTPQERHEKRKIKDSIRKNQEHVDALESIDKEAMLKADREARKHYDQEINKEYYLSSKFLSNTGQAALLSGVKMGIRQAAGLVLAEVWFELKDALPRIFQKARKRFELSAVFHEIKETIQNIWQRIKMDFEALLEKFKIGTIGGVLSSLSQTLVNIVETTTRSANKLIREMWQTLVKVAKLIFFNRQNLSFGELVKEVLKLISFGVATFAGVLIDQHLTSVLSMPAGCEIAAFLSALATGLMTTAIIYFIDYSPLMRSIWSFLDQFKSKHQKLIENYKIINEKLDQYLIGISKIEFNFNVDELQAFNDSLTLANNELEKSFIIDKEIERRGIELPNELKNADSTIDWLLTLCEED